MTAPPITFLIIDHTGHGGLARAVINVANQVSAHRSVRMVSVYARGEARYRLDPRIELSVLLPGAAPRRRHLLAHRAAAKCSELGADTALSHRSDRALKRWFERAGAGIVVTTRPTLHLAATRWAKPDSRLIGWDHKNFETRFANPAMVDVLTAAVPRLDRYVVLTAADADDYVSHFGLPPNQVRVLRNAQSWPTAAERASLQPKVFVAAGRLARVKGFDRMIDAYVDVADKFPDWQLHIYGDGPKRDALAGRIERHGLSEQIRLRGYVHDFREVLRSASAFLMTSRAEGFPMVLLEAMAEGLPLVAMDCPRGPAEIVKHGRNGFLVPNGDEHAFSRALIDLADDDALRCRLGLGAWQDSQRYSSQLISAEWRDLFDEVGW